MTVHPSTLESEQQFLCSDLGKQICVPVCFLSIEAMGPAKGRTVCFSVQHHASIPESQLQSLSHGFDCCAVCSVIPLSKHFSQPCCDNILECLFFLESFFKKSLN